MNNNFLILIIKKFSNEKAFAYCKSLNSIYIPNNVTSIRSDAFKKCTNLESIYIPTNVTSIEMGSFDMCHNLKNIYYKGSKNNWNDININKCTLNIEPLTDNTDGYYGYYKKNDYFNKYILLETSSAKWHYNSSISSETWNLL
ncbi:MAG: leucine-rich repeat protein [bacterium]